VAAGQLAQQRYESSIAALYLASDVPTERILTVALLQERILVKLEVKERRDYAARYYIDL
jgi:hypothetical protein